MMKTYNSTFSELEQILDELESEFDFASEIEFAEVDVLGIPQDNHWFTSQGEARKTALKRSGELGVGYGIAHHSNPARGLPHYHVVDANSNKVSGHYYYGKKPPRRELKGRPNREAEVIFQREIEAELEALVELLETDRPE